MNAIARKPKPANGKHHNGHKPRFQVPAKPAAAAAAKAPPRAGLLDLSFHPLSQLLPRMTPAEFAALKANVRRVGRVIEPIVLLDGLILDGRHRYEIARELKLPFVVRDFDRDVDGDPVEYVYSKVLHRHLDQSQKAAAAVGFLEEFEKAANLRMATTRVEGRTRAEMKKLLETKYNSGMLEHEYCDRTGKSFMDFIDLDASEAIAAILDVMYGYVGTSRDRAGELFAVSGKYIQDAKLLKIERPDLFARVFAGELPITRAKRELQRAAKQAAMVEKATAAEMILPRNKRWELICGDAVQVLPGVRVKSRLIFTDPRYNFGLDYGMGKQLDSSPEPEYLAWCGRWIEMLVDMLADDGSMFVMIDGSHQPEFAMMMKAAGLHWRQTIVCVERFGNYTNDNFTPAARFVLYFCKHRTRRVWNGEQILVPSARQTTYGDVRAQESGKVPDNVWEYPRLVDNAKERMPGFPTQLPVALLDRIVKVASEPGDLVVDPFNGTGTTGEAALRNGRRYLGVDIVRKNVDWASTRLKAVEGEISPPLSGDRR